MNITNLVHSLQEISNTINIVYNNSIWDKVKKDDHYLNTLKIKSLKDLNNTINDLQALQKERVGLEMGAWRV
tara:strand:- start:8318 stop:8533 length:216 start_codon:yes stop_codon:yes gene_type:complete